MDYVCLLRPVARRTPHYYTIVRMEDGEFSKPGVGVPEGELVTRRMMTVHLSNHLCVLAGMYGLCQQTGSEHRVALHV